MWEKKYSHPFSGETELRLHRKITVIRQVQSEKHCASHCSAMVHRNNYDDRMFDLEFETA